METKREMMMEAKPWYQSKSVWGQVFIAVGLLAGSSGYEVDAETQVALVDTTMMIVGGVMDVVGLVLTVIGRKNAKTTLVISKAKADSINA